MQRYDYYFRQKLTEAELDASFDAVEEALAQLTGAVGVVGLVQNGVATQKSTTPNISVDVSGPLVAYDADGNRIAVAALTNVPLNLDENQASTTVTTANYERYLSLFVKFTRVLTDPRVDGAGDTVFYNRAEGAEFVVVQGAQAPAGTASLPAMRADHVLLADIHLVFGQTAVVNADIGTARTQYVIVLAGTPKSVKARTFEEALQLHQDQINDIINGVVTIAAASVTYGGSPAWALGGAVTATNVEAALDEIVTDLAASSGAARVGFSPVGTLAATNVQAAIAEVISDLAAVTGAASIGFSPAGTISSTNVQGAIAELDVATAEVNSQVTALAVANAIGRRINAGTGQSDPQIEGIAYGGANNAFVAVGGSGGIFTAFGLAVTWTARTPAGAYASTFNAVAFGAGLFVAVGNTGEIQTSPTGVTWTHRTPAASYTGSFKAITYSGSLFVAVGSVGEIQTSPDGITWTHRTAAASYTNLFRTAVYGNGLFVIAGELREIQTSPDGITWTHRNAVPPLTLWFEASAYKDGVFVLAGGSTGVIQTSTDGITWTLRATIGTNLYKGIGFGGLFILTGGGGARYISSTGNAWRALFSPIPSPGELLAIGASPNLVVMGGQGGFELPGIITSLQV